MNTQHLIQNNIETIGNYQDDFLQHLQSAKYLVDIFLINGIKLQGNIQKFDKHSIFLTKKSDTKTDLAVQMVYKRAISTISCSMPTS